MTDQAEQSDGTTLISHLRRAWENFVSWLRGFIFGVTYYEMYMTLRRERADREHLFVLISFGDLLGIPILPPYYSMRLLPFVVPLLEGWKRRMLRERDLTDLVG
jgi:hypothetical protein